MSSYLYHIYSSDLTSTYFEGNGRAGLALHGHSRDGKPRNRQILVGQVMIDGWPIAHHVFEGNKRDSVTVAQVLDDIQKRFGLRRVVFVGDRGMVTSDNIDLLRSREQGYVVGLNRRRRPEVLRYLERATGPWLYCPAGIAASEKTEVPRTQVQEVKSDKPGVRVFVVHSDERLAYERAEREKAMVRVKVALESLAQRVNTGKLKAPEKIGAAAARTLARNHGYRYYDWKLEQGHFTYFEHPINLQREKSLEGKYLIQTEEQNLSALEAVAVYKELSEVERAFARLKDVIEMRPIFHQKASRVQAHAFVANEGGLSTPPGVAQSGRVKKKAPEKRQTASRGYGTVQYRGSLKKMMFLGMPLFYLTADPDGGQTEEKMHAHSRDILQSHLQPSSV